MSKVYFSTARTLRWDYSHSGPGKLETLLQKMNFCRPVHGRRMGRDQDPLGLPRRVPHRASGHDPQGR